MSNPWPERKWVQSIDTLEGGEMWEEPDDAYLIRMVQQLFVELAELRTLVAKPLYHTAVPDETENPYESDPDLISNRGKP